MKYLLSLAVVLSIVACHSKESSRFPESTIVQTDVFANVIDRGNNPDWLPMDYNSDPNFKDLAQFVNYFRSGRGDSTPVINDCPLADSIIVTLYPNPVPSGGEAILRMRSNVEILDFAYSYRAANGGVIGLSGGVYDAIISSDHKQVELSLSDSPFFPTDADVELYCVVITTDYCAHYTKGKIKLL